MPRRPVDNGRAVDNPATLEGDSYAPDATAYCSRTSR